MAQSNLLLAFLLTLIAGISTGVGSFLVLLTRRTNTRFLSLALGFSAGVMIYNSMIELFQDAQISLVSYFGETLGPWITVVGFFTGIIVIALIDHFIPEVENPHEVHTVEEMDGKSEVHKSHLMRMGLFTAMAIALHNFPEGIATFTTAFSHPALGVPVALAIALHNIPEGIAVAVTVHEAFDVDLIDDRLFIEGNGHRDPLMVDVTSWNPADENAYITLCFTL